MLFLGNTALVMVRELTDFDTVSKVPVKIVHDVLQ